MSLADGLAWMANWVHHPRLSHYQYGKYSISGDTKRFHILLANPALTCYKCGCQATHFRAELHRNELKRAPRTAFSFNPYSDSGKMLTWDHIVPKSLGGSNDVVNARIACEVCNSTRGNEMMLDELVWTLSQDHQLIYTIPPAATAQLQHLIKSSTLGSVTHGNKFTPENSRIHDIMEQLTGGDE
jgi:hypothetical protein